MKDAPNRGGMGYFDRDCETVEVDLSDPSMRRPGRPSGAPEPRRSAAPPPLPARSQAPQPQPLQAGAPALAYEAHAQALAQMNQMQQQQLQIQQQIQMQQLQQLQMQQQPLAFAQTARSAVEGQQEEQDNRLKFLLFGLAIGAVVVLVLSGNGFSNLRARLAFALMPDPPSTSTAAPPMAPIAAASVAPPPTAIPVVTPPPQPIVAQPIKVPEVDVNRLPKSGRGARVARKQQEEAPIAVPGSPTMPTMQPAEEPPLPPGADPGIELKAFEQLGKAFKQD